ncbi:MAG: DUF535 family protein [Sphingomonadaceae bacterium]
MASASRPSLTERVRFIASAYRNRVAIEPLLAADPQSLLGRTLSQQPALYNMARAPYLCATWTPTERIKHFIDHIAQADQMSPLFSFDISQEIRLLDLSVLGSGYHLLLDKPMWFNREGVVALNLFHNDVRLFTIAFAIAAEPSGLVAIIGGIQGRDLPNILDQYRALTKAAHGMRPRDLLIELFRMICRDQAIGEIRAIADSHRHHKSRYFGRDTQQALQLDYDAIWRDRGGKRLDDAFFILPTTRHERDPLDIPARKRSLYRQRYAMIEQLEASMTNAIANARSSALSVSL